MIEAAIVNMSESVLPSVGDCYPAADALTKIGGPAIAPCLRELEIASPRKRVVLCWVVKEVLGSEFAEEQLSAVIERTSDGEKRRNLSAAIALLKKDRWGEWESGGTH